MQIRSINHIISYPSVLRLTMANFLLLLLSLVVGIHRKSNVQAFNLPHDLSRLRLLKATKDNWSLADDWSSLSSENVENSSTDSAKIFNQDLAVQAAREMEEANVEHLAPSEEEVWLGDAIDEIHNAFSTLDESLYDTSFEEEEFTSAQSMDDAMDQEIAMLVRCNEYPEHLLVNEGRAIAPLTELEKNDPFQLVEFTQDYRFQPTQFLKESVSTIFHDHCISDPSDGMLSMDRKAIAKWMTKSLTTENEGLVSAHDSRVLQTLSEFGTYGSGRLVETDLENLYLSTIIGDTARVKVSNGVSPMRHLELRRPFVNVVWRDIRNHDILSPVEEEREQLRKEIESKYDQETTTKASRMDETTIMDECEILDFNWDAKSSTTAHADKKQASKSWSSHKIVDLASDQKTPLLVSDGKFST
jgi:hypothetical protein